MLLEQGDFIEMNFDPTVGHEPQKLRPALVVSTGYFNNVVSSLTVVCPITSRVNGHPLHIELPDNSPVSGCICIEAIRAVDLSDPRRNARSLEVCADQETMSQVLDALAAIFDL
ncbi:MAG: type II toxin-antitoxin system PemK/MazF family toxin [Atopobiaceae bacterium]|nr:type II toxin-antitoxin system PemK/MazF family toxin [Atopobiaceae bacterium]